MKKVYVDRSADLIHPGHTNIIAKYLLAFHKEAAILLSGECRWRGACLKGTACSLSLLEESCGASFLGTPASRFKLR